MKNISKNSVWIFLFTLLFAGFLSFALPAAKNLYQYYRLSETVEASLSKWFIEEVALGEFRIGASYSFEIDQKKYENETIFTSPKFRNPLAADEALNSRPDHLLAYYELGNADFSSLQKTFPLKECISAALLLVLIFYFTGLKIYAEKKL